MTVVYEYLLGLVRDARYQSPNPRLRPRYWVRRASGRSSAVVSGNLVPAT